MLTGKDVYAFARPFFEKQGIHMEMWEQLPEEPMAFYTFIAASLNEAHIAPLQGLVRDYQEFSKYATPLLKRGRLEWEAESETLAQRAQALLTPKES